MSGSLYFHIPFCSRKCDYCHFYVIPNKEPYHNQLINALQMEWELRSPLLKGWEIVSLYFGGGTPALLAPEALGNIIEWAQPLLHPDAEITLEANPENITPELMRDFADAGINRASIGLQSLDPALLKTLSRTHTADQGKQAVFDTFEAGIKNISVDLMYDLPGQTIEQWQTTLDQVVRLPMSHLSLYNLTFEPHTIFYKKRNQLQPQVPDEISSTEMYRRAVAALEQNGLSRYEISAFAKTGFHSRHNTGYWTGRPFFGFGPSAFSYWNHKRFRNTANLNRYAQVLSEGRSPVDFEEKLEPEAKARELLTIGLRLREGVALSGLDLLDISTLKTIDSLIDSHLLTKTNSHLALTERGILLYDTVAAELV